MSQRPAKFEPVPLPSGRFAVVQLPDASDAHVCRLVSRNGVDADGWYIRQTSFADLRRFAMSFSLSGAREVCSQLNGWETRTPERHWTDDRPALGKHN